MSGLYSPSGASNGFYGGLVEVGVNPSKGVLKTPVDPTQDPAQNGCDWGTGFTACPVNQTAVPGFYAILQGQPGNSAGPSNGYIGLSNYDSSNAGGTGDTNSGGSIILNKQISIYGTPSPLVCGATSGNNWNNTTREGCGEP